jgi:hypothetical protein
MSCFLVVFIEPVIENSAPRVAAGHAHDSEQKGDVKVLGEAGLNIPDGFDGELPDKQGDEKATADVQQLLDEGLQAGLHHR